MGSLRLISAARADRLDEIRKAGMLRVAAFDSNPPFGVPDPATKRVAGLDLDYAQAIADTIGVPLEMRPTNPANRIPLVTPGKVDLVPASFTIAEERARQVDFSIPSFVFDQQFLAKKGTLSSSEHLSGLRIGGLRIGAEKGTIDEIVRRRDCPKAVVVASGDTPFAFTAQRNSSVQAITQDGPKLVGLPAKVPDRGSRLGSPRRPGWSRCSASFWRRDILPDGSRASRSPAPCRPPYASPVRCSGPRRASCARRAAHRPAEPWRPPSASSATPRCWEEGRAGIKGVHAAQRQAALARGLTPLQAFRPIVLPQALRIAWLPITWLPIVGRYLDTMKNTSLTLTIGLAELSYASRQVETETFMTVQAFGIATRPYVGAVAPAEALGQATARRAAPPGSGR